MKNLKYIIPVLIFFVFYSCKKDKPTNPPTISFIKEPGYIWSDTAIKLGTQVKIGVKATNNEVNITYFNLNLDNGTIQTALDSGLNSSSLTFSKTITKSSSQNEKWIFTVMDKNRNKASLSITFTKAYTSSYNDINTYSSVLLGAQNNSSLGSFFSLTHGSIFNLIQAYQVQDSIDIIYYYHPTYSSLLSSPGETEAPNYFTGTNGISDWSIKNVSYYDTTKVTTTQFDQSKNDSLMLNVYDPISGKKKAKYLVPGIRQFFT